MNEARVIVGSCFLLQANGPIIFILRWPVPEETRYRFAGFRGGKGT